jgi:hypothetical protein
VLMECLKVRTPDQGWTEVSALIRKDLELRSRRLLQ